MDLAIGFFIARRTAPEGNHMYQNNNRTAKLFVIAHITETEVNEGTNEALAIGVNNYGARVGIVENYASDALEMIREQIEQQGYAAMVTLTGQAVDDPSELANISRLAGREINMALRGILSMRFIDQDENKVTVKVSRRGNLRVSMEPRFGRAVNTKFTCLSCHNAGRPAAQTVGERDMETVQTANGRTMTMAACPSCDAIMTRTGDKSAKAENHAGTAELNLVFEAPEFAYCVSCRQKVRRIWLKSVRKSDSQPRPSYRGNCFRCLGMVATPWQQTRMVPIKRHTVEKIRQAALAAEEATHQAREARWAKRHETAQQEAIQAQAQAAEQEEKALVVAMDAFKERYNVA